MWGHFRHLHFKTFSMVSYKLNLVIFSFFNKGPKYLELLDKCNSQSRNALGSHWAPSLALSSICESVFHIQTHFLDLMGPYTPHLVMNPMLGLQQLSTCNWKIFFAKTTFIFIFLNKFVLGFKICIPHIELHFLARKYFSHVLVVKEVIQNLLPFLRIWCDFKAKSIVYREDLFK